MTTKKAAIGAAFLLDILYPYGYHIHIPLMVSKENRTMKPIMEKLEHLLQLGGIKKDILFLVLSGIAIVCSLLGLSPFPFDMAWIAIILCGVPIILEAIIGLVTAFDIKADVLVSLALIASVFIGEDFAAGEVAFIMQLGNYFLQGHNAE